MKKQSKLIEALGEVLEDLQGKTQLNVRSIDTTYVILEGTAVSREMMKATPLTI